MGPAYGKAELIGKVACVCGAEMLMDEEKSSLR